MSTIKTTTLSTQGGSTVPVDTVVNGTAKAWVNFNGTGTVAIRRAFNVSSVTDNAVGAYTVNFSNSMASADYAVSGCTQGDDGNDRCFLVDVVLVESVKVRTTLNGGSSDRPITCVAIFS